MTSAERAKDLRLQKTFNTTLDKQNCVRVFQGNACAICGRNFNKYMAFQDHEHKCCPRRLKTFCGKCNRGLLCFLCNKYVVGVLERNAIKGELPMPIIELCKRIIAYFEHWNPILIEKGCYLEKPEAKKAAVRKKKKRV
jgi:hypothetical protein